MMKRIALAVMASSLFFACGGDEEDDKDKCTLDEAAVCTSKNWDCGTVVAQDSCGEQKSITCGSCADDMTCQSNKCVSKTPDECVVSDEAKTAACQNKCGTVQVMDSCNQFQKVDCGTDSCGAGKVCHISKNECMNESDCALSDEDKAANCGTDSCGGAMAPDYCGNMVYIECASAANPVDMLADFKDLKDNGMYNGKLARWDDNYLLALLEIENSEDPEDSKVVYLVFKENLKIGQTYALKPLTVVDGLYTCVDDACVLSVISDGRFGSHSGSVTITEDANGGMIFSIKDSVFTDIDSANCYTSKIDFSIYFAPPDCTSMDVLATFKDLKDTNGNYVSDLGGWNNDYAVAALETETADPEDAEILYLLFKKSLENKTYNLSSLEVVNDRYTCTKDACILAATDDGRFSSKSGSVTISLEEDTATFSLTDVVLTNLDYANCDVPAVSFTMVYVAAPIDCSTLDPMSAFTATNGGYTGIVAKYNETHNVAALQGTDKNGIKTDVFVIYKGTLVAGTYDSISATDEKGNCTQDVCAAVVGGSGKNYWYDPTSSDASLVIGDGFAKFTLSSPGFVDFYTKCPLTLDELIINIATE